MNVTTTLVRREWLQHRFGWALMAVLPTVIGALVLSFGQVQIDGMDELGPRKGVTLALASLAVPTMLHLAIFALGSLIIVTGLSRRDHADRSVEFWLSMPTGHAHSLAVPLAVHLVLAPLAALGLGLVSGLLLSSLLVARTVSLEAWAALPWGMLLLGAGALVARLALGVMLAVLWLSPLVLAVVLATAWLKRWGLVALAVGVGLGSALMDKLMGYPWPWALLTGLTDRASRSLLNAGEQMKPVSEGDAIERAIELLPSWLAEDAAAALAMLASPWTLGVLVASGVLFAGLVHWRRQGAAAGS